MIKRRGLEISTKDLKSKTTNYSEHTEQNETPGNVVNRESNQTYKTWISYTSL